MTRARFQSYADLSQVFADCESEADDLNENEWIRETKHLSQSQSQENTTSLPRHQPTWQDSPYKVFDKSIHGISESDISYESEYATEFEEEIIEKHVPYEVEVEQSNSPVGNMSIHKSSRKSLHGNGNTSQHPEKKTRNENTFLREKKETETDQISNNNKHRKHSTTISPISGSPSPPSFLHARKQPKQSNGTSFTNKKTPSNIYKSWNGNSLGNSDIEYDSAEEINNHTKNDKFNHKDYRTINCSLKNLDKKLKHIFPSPVPETASLSPTYQSSIEIDNINIDHLDQNSKPPQHASQDPVVQIFNNDVTDRNYRETESGREHLSAANQEIENVERNEEKEHIEQSNKSSEKNNTQNNKELNKITQQDDRQKVASDTNTFDYEPIESEPMDSPIMDITNDHSKENSSNRGETQLKTNGRRRRHHLLPPTEKNQTNKDEDNIENEEMGNKLSKKSQTKNKVQSKSNTKPEKVEKKSRKRKSPDSPLTGGNASRRVRHFQDVVISPTDNTDPELRRSKRVRFKPLKFWAGERIDPTSETLNYEKVKNKGDEVVILGIDYLEDCKQQLANKRKIKRNRSKPKNREKSERNTKHSKEESTDITMETEEYVPYTEFDSTALVYDNEKDNVTRIAVARLKEMIPLRIMNQELPEDVKQLRSDRQIRGGKAFETDNFSIGVVQIPPNGIKYPEVTLTDEIFFVTSCGKNQLALEIGHTPVKYLSEGAIFWVPNNNKYSLKNLSKTHTIKLNFVLFRKDKDVNEDENEEEMK